MTFFLSLGVPQLMIGGAVLALFIVWLIYVATRPLTPQKRSRVYVRSPRLGEGEAKPPRWAYDAEEDVAKAAEKFYEYAALAAASYQGSSSSCDPWVKQDFPDPTSEKELTLQKKIEKVDLQYDVWVKSGPARVVAVVFRGTESWLDWKSNFRWFLGLFPRYEDQYDVVERHVASAFHEWLMKKDDLSKHKLVAVGHSLGGGLAQYFAYVLPNTRDQKARRVSEVYAFASSPVTGYFTVRDRGRRNSNAKQLDIYHVFEHGEILAFVRLLLGSTMRALGVLGKPSGRRGPRRWTFRFNLSKSADPIKSHGIAELTALLDEFRTMEPTTDVTRPERRLQLELIYDYIKFHIGLFIGTPPVIAILGEGLQVTHRPPFTAGIVDMIILYILSGISAGWFMGTHVNRRWAGDFLEEFEQSAFSPVRRFFHHWIYWAGLFVGLTGLLLALIWPEPG